MTTLITTTEPAGMDPCPHCGGTGGVREVTSTGTPPRVQAWSCGTGWAFTVASPAQLFLDHLTATVQLAAARRVLRGIIALADQAPVLTREQLRCRLLTLATCAAPRSPAPRSPIGRWSSVDAPDAAPSGRSALDLAPAQTPAGHRSNPVPGVQPVPPPAGADHADLAGTGRNRG